MITISIRGFVLAFLVLVTFDILAQPLQRLKLEGVWQDDKFVVNRVKQRSSGKDVRNMRISGRIHRIDHENRQLQVGPGTLRWDASLQEQVESYDTGSMVEIRGRAENDGTISVRTIEPVKLEDENALEVIGAVIHIRETGQWTEMTIGGTSALVPQRLYNKGRVRIRRLDDRRPDDQASFNLGSTVVTLGGEIEFGLDIEDDRDIDRTNDDDRLDLDAGFQLEALFAISDSVSAFLELKGEHNRRYDLPIAFREDESEISFGEAWLYLEGLFSTPVSLQIGRQNFAEDREWWWDDDLDAIRMYFEGPSFHFQIGIAEEFSKVVLNDEHRDEEEREVFRILANATWPISSELSIDAFFLYQNDHSREHAPGVVLPYYREDENDADLAWFGARLSGDFEWKDTYDVSYWADVAFVRGDEIQYGFDDVDDLRLVLESRRDFHRSGEAVDVGASFRWTDVRWGLFSEPTLTIGYAYGSGEKNSRNSFRETGLNDNNGKFNGVDRFRYYGELVNPRLENLNVTTAAFGLRFFDQSSIELLHHNYTQVNKSMSHSLRIDPDTTGRSRALGNEFDVVVGIEQWQHWEFEVVGAYFIPGKSFDDDDDAWQVSFKLNYNF